MKNNKIFFNDDNTRNIYLKNYLKLVKFKTLNDIQKFFKGGDIMIDLEKNFVNLNYKIGQKIVFQ